MNFLVEEYTEMVLQKYESYNPTVIAYGSNCYGVNDSDLDVCIIVDNDFNQKENLIEDTIIFSKEKGIKVDDEIPHSNKLVFTYKQVEKILMESLFINDKGIYYISDIVKTKKFLNSKEMYCRLLLNILTTEHRIMCGNRKFIELCQEKAWMLIIDVLINTYKIGENVDEEVYINLLYRNPYTGSEGEWYLGYKRNYPKKDIYLRKSFHKYLKIYMEREIDLSSNTNPYFPTISMMVKIYDLINKVKKYPENKDITLRKTIALLYGLNEHYVMVTNGSMEAIHIIVDKYILKEAAIIQPSFWGYDNRFEKLDKKYCNVIANIDTYLNDIRQACRRYHYVVICNPNNPTLAEITLKDIEKLLNDFPECTIIVDETIMAFKNDYLSNTAINCVKKYNNLVVLMSLSKISGLCGLRCGYIVANSKIIETLISQKALYSTNSLCQHFFNDYVEVIINSNFEKKKIQENFKEFIQKLDKRYVTSIRERGGAFILINFSNNVNLEQLESELVCHNIYIQYIKKTYPKFKGNWVRISAGTRSDLILLVNFLNAYMKKISKE